MNKILDVKSESLHVPLSKTCIEEEPCLTKVYALSDKLSVRESIADFDTQRCRERGRQKVPAYLMRWGRSLIPGNEYHFQAVLDSEKGYG